METNNLEKIKKLEKKIEVLQLSLNDLIYYLNDSLRNSETYVEFRPFIQKYLEFNEDHVKQLEDVENSDFLDETNQFELEYSEMIMDSVRNKNGGKKNNKTRKIKKQKKR